MTRILLLFLMFAGAVAAAMDTAGPELQFVRIRVAEGLESARIAVDTPLSVLDPSIKATLPPGEYTVRLRDARPATQRFHLFGKTFLPHQIDEQAAFIELARARGLSPEVVVVGKTFTTAEGTKLDNRVHWISIARYPGEREAEEARKRFEAQEQWSWMHAEITAAGTGTIEIVDASGSAARLSTPVEMNGGGITIETARRNRYGGRIELDVGPDGKLEIRETVSLEDYLRGVLPGEMPTSWPLEALKAQAVSARSEVLAHLAGKHQLEGVDFCGEVHCRAYRGSAYDDPNANRAIDETRGEILLQGNRVAATVFSANCGGWTENNDMVWSGPPDAALRGASDAVNSVNSPASVGWWRWITKPPEAYCQGDEDTFRWRRSFSTDELSAIVNRRHDVGRIRAIEPGERGVSGRLRSVRVVGAKRSETIYKELPVRRAFGDLPSAMFVVQAEPTSNPTRFTFIGGGRGHGVGLCQHGANGRARQGLGYTAILMHYFSGVRIERFR